MTHVKASHTEPYTSRVREHPQPYLLLLHTKLLFLLPEEDAYLRGGSKAANRKHTTKINVCNAYKWSTPKIFQVT